MFIPGGVITKTSDTMKKCFPSSFHFNSFVSSPNKAIEMDIPTIPLLRRNDPHKKMPMLSSYPS